MPKSKRRKRGKRTALPGRESSNTRERSRARVRTGWALAVVGLALFVVGNIGARTGIALPFDPHHLLTQWGGGAVATAGVLLATGLRGGRP